LQTVAPGEARGPLFGGNLTLLHACAAAGRLQVPQGCILFLEDVGERAYRVDRMITTLMVGGHLKAPAGVVVGELADCDGGVEVLCAELARLGVPVARGLPCGHGRCNEPLCVGAPAVLDATSGELALFRELEQPRRSRRVSRRRAPGDGGADRP
jgi:muramoyltetrapeptide carboxypeptidase